jgi:DNA-binding transcriptional ArsR family regulator
MNAVEIHKALSNPDRIEIMNYLFQRKTPACNSEICVKMKLNQSNVSKHLKKLLFAGLIVADGFEYRINNKIKWPILN